MVKAISPALAGFVVLTGICYAGDQTQVSAGCFAGDKAAIDKAGLAVATADRPAVFSLKRADLQRPAQALELTVKPVVVSPDEEYLVEVFVVDRSSLCIEPRKERSLGTFSFFPRPRGNEGRTFIVAPPTEAEFGSADSLALAIRLLAANPEGSLKDSALEVVDAQLK